MNLLNIIAWLATAIVWTYMTMLYPSDIWNWAFTVVSFLICFWLVKRFDKQLKARKNNI